MHKSNTCFLLTTALLFSLLIISAGCGREALKNDMGRVQQDLVDIEIAGAKVCAPKEFASAEAYLDFARGEYLERNYIAVDDNLIESRKHIEAARPFLATCVETIPPDTDGDGLLNNVDKCPDQPEDFDEFEDADGCPDPDNDQDGIADVDDKCPLEPEIFNEVDDEDGCPDFKFVKVEDSEIVLNQKIHFETGSDVITPESFVILDEIASILAANPSWKIDIEGHTDNVGKATSNIKLSQSRAESCRTYLVEKDIDVARMSAAGYGPTRPIAPNMTEAGMAMNRRVEFQIVDK
jgi:outer membrane protein OmpA-like peptidoglycan-associated protein